MAESYRERAERGAALLDRLMPSWFKLIKLDELKLASCTNCVCGQIARRSAVQALRDARKDVPREKRGEWISWTHTTQWIAKKLNPRKRDPWFGASFEHGFTANSDYGYDQLDKEWGRIVRERLEKAAQS